jgi:chaperone protein EcpD
MRLSSLRHLLACALLAATGIGMLPAAHAGVVIVGTRIIFDAKDKDRTIQLNNQDDAPAMIQAWIDAGDADAKASEIRVPFVLTPPLARIEPRQGQSLRLLHTPQGMPGLPVDRESVFYFNVLEIPPRRDAGQDENLLQLAVRSRIKLFYRPEGLEGKSREAPARLTWKQGRDADGAYLEVHNPSRYHVSLAAASVGGASASEPAMIAPGATSRMVLDKAPLAGTAVQFDWIDDFGGHLPATATLTP